MSMLLNNWGGSRGIRLTRHLSRQFLFDKKIDRMLSTTTLHHKLLHKKIQTKQAFASNDVRQAFIDFFVGEHGHRYHPSSPVTPDTSDQSLLFVNAGMNQFKPIFLDQQHLFEDFKRVVNSQKCIRVGGKHCDLDAVGKDFIHHTFFEMLGNWSFNDYFKREACEMAWTLLTEVFHIDPSRLLITIFGGSEKNNLPTDFETYEIWRSIGVPVNQIVPLGERDNFWEMGKIGPCGICTEIHYINETADLSKLDSILKNSVEIWNIVFIQYFRDENEKLHRLEKNYIDTGMGLERILSILQGVPNNYETDLFTPYFDRLMKLCNWPRYGGKLNDSRDISYRILADHSRMASVAISDHVHPDDRGAGYLLRRVLRRSIEAVRTVSHFHPLPDGLNEADVLKELALVSVETLGGAFPELERESNTILQVINDEVVLFSSAIIRNIYLMNLAKSLGMELNESPSENETEVKDKLQDIEADIKQAKTLILENRVLDNGPLDDCRKDLHNLQNLITNDTVLSQRFGLSNTNIEESIERLNNELTELENAYHSSVESIVQEFEILAKRNLFSCNHFSILSLQNNFVEYQGIDNLLLKISLDLLGEKPLVTLITPSKVEEDPDYVTILLQLSVSGDFHKKLQADAWFEQAWAQTIDHFDTLHIDVEQIKTKRTKKIVKYRCKLYHNQIKCEDFVEVFRKNCINVGKQFAS